MGKIDTITKDYMKNPVIFADAFNKYLYHGKQVIKPESLREMDTTEIVIPYGNNGVGVPEQKYRDVLKLMMTDGNIAYCILGVENQSDIHYAMPVKSGVYDFMQLAHQVAETVKSHKRKEKMESKKKGEEYKPSSDEYLSGFYKTDRLLPIITLVIYFGTEEWDGPLSLKEMYSATDETIMQYVPDYKVNLIAPNRMSDEEIEEFKSSLREVMIFNKYSKWEDREKLDRAVYENENFKHLDRQAAEVINATTNAKINFSGEKEAVDMCQAIQAMREESKQQGMKQGMQQGIDIIVEVVQKLRNGDSVEILEENYGKDVVEKALLIK